MEQVKFYQQAQLCDQLIAKEGTKNLSNAFLNLSVFAVTFNMARLPQDINFSIMVPTPEKYDIVVWGA